MTNIQIANDFFLRELFFYKSKWIKTLPTLTSLEMDQSKVHCQNFKGQKFFPLGMNWKFSLPLKFFAKLMCKEFKTDQTKKAVLFSMQKILDKRLFLRRKRWKILKKNFFRANYFRHATGPSWFSCFQIVALNSEERSE